jgi:hypothetical protein
MGLLLFSTLYQEENIYEKNIFGVVAIIGFRVTCVRDAYLRRNFAIKLGRILVCGGDTLRFPRATET